MLYPVSDAYIAAMRTPIREARQHCKLSLGIIDNTAAGDASYTWSNAVWGPDFSAIAGDEACRTSGIASFEHDYFRLDGKQMLISDDYSAHDYVSAALSGPNGVYATPPEITVSFGVTHTLVGLSLGFGPYPIDAPAQMTFLWYADGALISQNTVSFGETPYQQEELDITGADKLVIRYDSAQKLGRRARLCQLVYGIGYEFQDTQILSLDERHTDAPVSTSLPTSSLSFNLDNAEGRFTADSDNSLVQFLADQQKITVNYGVDLSDGTEWVPGGVWYLSGWSSSGARASFSAVDRIELLTKTQYEKGIYDWSNHSAKSLAEAVFLDAGLSSSDYYIDPSISVSFSAPLPIGSHADELELLANRTNANLVSEKTGEISLKRFTLYPTFKGLPPSATTRYTDYSDVQSVINNSGVSFATFESDFFRLDGGIYLLGDDITVKAENSGMTSKEISGENGTLSSTGALIYYVYSDTPTEVYEITMNFGGRTPKTVTVMTRINSTWSSNQFHPDKNVYTCRVSKSRIDGLEVYIQDLGKANARAHINGVAVTAISDFTIDEKEAFDVIQTKLNQKLKNVTAEWVYRSYYPSVTETLATARIETNSGWARIEHPCGYEPSMAVSIDDSSGVTIEQTHYAFVSYIRLTSAATKTINATITSNKMYEVSYPIFSVGNDTGGNLPLKNALYDSTNIQNTLDWTRDYYKQRVEYSLETKGYPELECGDFVRARDGSPAQIIETDLTYNGAFREKFKLRKKG